MSCVIKVPFLLSIASAQDFLAYIKTLSNITALDWSLYNANSTVPLEVLLYWEHIKKELIYTNNIEMPYQEAHPVFVPINKEAQLASDRDKFEAFLRTKVKNKDLSGLNIAFAEAYMNVCHHTELESGFMLVYCNSEQQILRVICSDIGIGIATKVKHYLSDDAIDDELALRMAIKEGFTTQSRRNNAGKGLANIINNVLGHDGSFKLISGLYQLTLTHTETNPQGEQLDYNHIGTFLDIVFDLRALDEQLEEDFNNNIDF